MNPAPTVADWDAVPKGDLAHALYREQRGTCCYCASRLEPLEGRTRAWVIPRGPTGRALMGIEHIYPKSRPGPDGTHAHAFDWANLALACDGGVSGEVHCDKSKGSTPLEFIHPRARPVARHTRLGSNGKLRAAPQALTDVETTLRLNATRLVALRRAVLQGVCAGLGDRHRWTANALNRAADELGDEVGFHAHVVDWLKRQAHAR